MGFFATSRTFITLDIECGSPTIQTPVRRNAIQYRNYFYEALMFHFLMFIAHF